MNILIASAGILRSNEIKTLAEMLNKKHSVTIAAMATDSPFKGQSFSFGNNPVQVDTTIYKDSLKSTGKENKTKKENPAAFDGITAYEFHSTPADLISVMLGEIMLSRRPDLVICGINNGAYMGEDIYCSSSVNMAMESLFFKIPAIAVGIEHQVGGHSEEGCMNAVKFIEKNLDNLANIKLPSRTFLNICIPTVENYKDLRGIKVTEMDHLRNINNFIEKTDPRGEKYYWSNKINCYDSSESTGAKADFDSKFVVIIPLSFDATDYKCLKPYEELEKATYKATKEVTKQQKGGTQ